MVNCFPPINHPFTHSSLFEHTLPLFYGTIPASKQTQLMIHYAIGIFRNHGNPIISWLEMEIHTSQPVWYLVIRLNEFKTIQPARFMPWQVISKSCYRWLSFIWMQSEVQSTWRKNSYEIWRRSRLIRDLIQIAKNAEKIVCGGRHNRHNITIEDGWQSQESWWR